MYYKSRPSIVTAASVILYVMGGLAALGGLVALAASGSADEHSGLIALWAVVILALGVLYIVLATKILGGSNGARVTTIVFMCLGIVLDVVNFQSSSIISIALALLVIGLLSWNQDAKDYFAG